ncbi:MAG TPA: hypothetical protein VGZ93_10870 [Candidatus Methylacidiphilales bacterium]|jgi:glutamine synthetase|nr:hypothetical protein [Candidatus Methylacidiphilales bacterium]
MSSTHQQKARIRPLGEHEVAQMQKEMEARRKTMVKLMEDSEAKLKLLLRANPHQHSGEAKRRASEG